MDIYSRWAFDQDVLTNSNERLCLIVLASHMNPETYFVDMEKAKPDLLTIYKSDETLRRILKHLFEEDLILLYSESRWKALQRHGGKEQIKAVQVNFRGQAKIDKRKAGLS